MARLVSQYFSSNGSWVAPAGVTNVFVLAQGGSGGGSGGYNSTGVAGLGGSGCVPILRCVTVVPNTSYTVTIGTAGSGGAPRTSSSQNGGTGGNTTFGALYTFYGAPVASGGATDNTFHVKGADSSSIAPSASYYETSGYYTQDQNWNANSGSYIAGRNGSPGYGGVGGVGGAANSSGTGSNGANSAYIGAGGGGGGAGSSGGGTGGNGYAGQLWVIWVE